jgi:hypothetical protein
MTPHLSTGVSGAKTRQRNLRFLRRAPTSATRVARTPGAAIGRDQRSDHLGPSAGHHIDSLLPIRDRPLTAMDPHSP